MSTAEIQAKVEAQVNGSIESITNTVVGIVTAVGAMVVGLGVVSSTQEGAIVAFTVSGLAAVGVISNAVHTGSISPSAIQVAVASTVAQAVVLLVSFAVIGANTGGTVIAVSSAVVLGAAQLAHALFSRKVAV